ncbi:MAG: sugar phosphate isomerase/epimerase family protein [Pseudomonadota bacterium]
MMPTAEQIARVKSRVQVNVPLAMLMDGYLAPFLALGINPEIGLDAAVLDRCAVDDLRSIADAFQHRGRTVTLHGPFIDLSAGSRDARIRDVTVRRFEQLVDAAAVFRPVSVVCHGGYDWRRYAFFRDEWLAGSLEAWRWLAGALAGAGSRLMLENVYERGPDEALPLMDALSADGVGWCLDIGHANAFGERPVAEWLETLGPHIGQMHLHDNAGDTDEHLPLGDGRIDLKAVLRFLETRAATPPILTLEPHREADLAPSLAYLARYWIA